MGVYAAGGQHPYLGIQVAECEMIPCRIQVGVIRAVNIRKLEFALFSCGNRRNGHSADGPQQA
jgi:hypothetical protein